MINRIVAVIEKKINSTQGKSTWRIRTCLCIYVWSLCLLRFCCLVEVKQILTVSLAAVCDIEPAEKQTELV